MKTRKIKFAVNVVKWFDKINGNTYHSVNILDTRTGKRYVLPQVYTYGYGDSYKQSTIDILLENKLIPAKYKDNLYLYDRENNYPIEYNVINGLKRDMKRNGTI